MELSFKIISAPGSLDGPIHDFMAENDHDFYPPIAKRRDLSEFVQSVYDHKGKYVICYLNDKLVGVAAVYLNHPAFICYYLYVAVDKAYRHMGIANDLFNHIHEICRKAGIQRAIVKTWSTNLVSQAMFKKHGFFHIDTLEDDRSKGIHTYFFARSFIEGCLQQPPAHLGIISDCHSYTTGNFVKTISFIPRTISKNQTPLPYITIATDSFRNRNSAAFFNSTSLLEQQGVTHLLSLEAFGGVAVPTELAGMEVVDIAAITGRLVNERKVRCLVVCKDKASVKHLAVDHTCLPRSADQSRLEEIINEVAAGKVTPGYYKQEIAQMAIDNQCAGVLLAAYELHTMFGFDKQYNGVEIFDPLMEIAVIMQCERLKLQEQLPAAKSQLSV
jgi:N-acetylglutamate synthase-like GNAT family acetyltransferase